MLHGAKIGYFQGDIRLLSDDLITLRPTVFPVVPRLLNRMYDKVGGQDGDNPSSLSPLWSSYLTSVFLQIFGQANTSLKRWLLGFAYRRKEAEIMKGIVRTDSIWDQLIFRKVQVHKVKKTPMSVCHVTRIVHLCWTRYLKSVFEFIVILHFDKEEDKNEIEA